MASLPLRTIEDLYNDTANHRDIWLSKGNYMMYLHSSGPEQGRTRLSHNGVLLCICDYKGIYHVAGTSASDRDAINSLLMLNGRPERASLKGGRVSIEGPRPTRDTTSVNVDRDQLAYDLVTSYQEIDPYEYHDAYDSVEDAVRETRSMLDTKKGRAALRGQLTSYVDEGYADAEQAEFILSIAARLDILDAVTSANRRPSNTGSRSKRPTPGRRRHGRERQPVGGHPRVSREERTQHRRLRFVHPCRDEVQEGK